MHIAISGSHGLIGTALVHRLESKGHVIHRLVRKPGGAEGDSRNIRWQPVEGEIEAGKLEGIDAVVHLAGENVAGGTWTKHRKLKIMQSRVKGTATLCGALAGLKNKPGVLASGSAIGYYGDRDDEVLTEQSGPGSTFLGEVAQAWEDATVPAENAGIRVVLARTGVVLSPKGGALKRMLTPFKWGLGGKIGDGEQWMSWITLEDEIAAIEHAIETDALSGPVNFVSPNPVTNAEFTQTLGEVLSRPTFMTLPAFLAELALGEMAEELLLASARCAPTQLEESGFHFEHPALEEALRAVLGEKDSRFLAENS